MKCRVCDQHELVSLTFYSLFYREIYCSSCKKKYVPKIEEIAFPIELGSVSINFLFGWKNHDDILESRLFLFWEKLLQIAISQQHNFDLIIWSDEEIWTVYPIWIRLFESIGTIYIFSLFLPPIELDSQFPRII
jgi:hypothetical protein